MAISKKKELRVGLALNYLATAVGLISSLVFNPIIIRTLGKNEYGLYETIGAFVNYLAVLDLGFGAVVIRYTAKYEAEGLVKERNEFLYRARRIYQYLALAVLLGGAILYGMLDTVFGNAFTPEELQKAHVLFVFVLGTTALSIYGQVYSGALTGVEKFILPRIIRVAKIIFGKVVSILIILLGADSVGYTAVLFGFEVMGVLVNRSITLRYVSFAKCKVHFSEIKELMVFTGFIFLQAIASQLYWQIDKLVLGAVMGTSVVAVYSVSMNLHNIVQNISSSVKDVLLPRATQIAVGNQSKEQLQGFMIGAGRLVAMVYGLALAGLTVFGNEFIVLWLGEEYLDAFPVYLVLGYAGFLPCVLTIGETVCRAYNKHQFLSYVFLSAALFNVVLTILFVGQWGMTGAVTATAIGLVVANTIIPLWYYKKTFNLNIFGFCWGVFKGIVPSLVVTAAAGTGMNFLFYSYSWVTLVLKAAITCLCFMGALLLIGFTPQEKRSMTKLLEKWIRKKKVRI